MSMLELAPWRKDKKRLARASGDEWLSSLHHRLDRMFDDFLSTEFPSASSFRWSEGFSPDMDVSETDSEIEVTAELPGLDEKDVEVTLADGVLTVKGEKKSESKEEDKEKNHYRLERTYGAFRRTFQLPAAADDKKVSASFDKGVLTVTIAKKKEAKAAVKKIEVKKAA